MKFIVVITNKRTTKLKNIKIGNGEVRREGSCSEFTWWSCELLVIELSRGGGMERGEGGMGGDRGLL